ncbi:MAG: M23 family metallopeptidase [Clostridiales bacterium]|nr:M23 family metallopeptidase [Clostridiales bacterium]
MKERIDAFWRGYGFYISVAVGVLLLGGAAYWARGRIATPAPAPTARQVDAAPEYVQSLRDVEAPATPTPAPRPDFAWPLEREDAPVIVGYSPDAPVWSATLNQWQAHGGIDIQGEPGAVVLAAADGAVARTYVDPLMGNVVEIDHGMGYRTRYASLGTLQMASAGDRVMRGSVIGSVGKSAASEAALPAHLHFEVWRDDQLVDPMEIY